MSSIIRFTVDDKAVRAALAALPEKVNETVRRKGARKALAPFVKTLRSTWLSMPFKGKNTHRKAIAAATQLDIRRTGQGPSAPLRVKLGVRYGFKGGSKAKGRQRLFHLIESGFNNKPAGGVRVPGLFYGYKWSRANLARMTQAVSDEILNAARAALKGGK